MTGRAPLTMAVLCCLSFQVHAGAFVFADQTEPDIITHPSNYTGAGGSITVSVCIASDSESIDDILVPLQNTLLVWNELEPVTGNVQPQGQSNLPAGQLDFESVLLHEIGHCIGLAHPNLGTEWIGVGGLMAADLPNDFTQSAPGPNDEFDLNDGADGIPGSADDLRTDDVNLHWFRKSNNNPFTIAAVVDASTYSRQLLDLPVGHNYAANANRELGAELGFPETEAAMGQGILAGEAHRSLNHDDVATARLAMSGLDRTQGTGTDYDYQLHFDGVADDCDITVRVSGNSVGFCQVGGVLLSPDHFRVTTATAILGSAANFNWFFNQEPLFDLIFADGFESEL